MFGGRGSGKSTLLKTILSDDKSLLWYDLLNEELARQLLLDPMLLERQVLAQKPKWVVIDEIQKVPALLNVVQRLIENQSILFALTCSSARKLKREGANLLAGRAFVNYLHPLTQRELGDDFNLETILPWGSLPKTLSFTGELERREFLKAYVSTYLKEEIKEEQVIRKLEPFIRFIEIAAQCNGQPINSSKIGRGAGVDAKAIDRYFEILTDTLLGFFLPPFDRSVRKRQLQRSKFYFFDLGVKRALENQLTVPLMPQTYGYGRAFEHFFILECIRYNDYYRKDYRFSYLRTKDNLEIDLIIERPGKPLVLLEIKSSTNVDDVELSKLQPILEKLAPCELWIASQEKAERRLKKGDGLVLPWMEALERLFGE
ncbi:AAA family ATPase [Bdellovibrionota bacterium FG-2]